MAGFIHRKGEDVLNLQHHGVYAWIWIGEDALKDHWTVWSLQEEDAANSFNMLFARLWSQGAQWRLHWGLYWSKEDGVFTKRWKRWILIPTPLRIPIDGVSRL